MRDFRRLPLWISVAVVALLPTESLAQYSNATCATCPNGRCTIPNTIPTWQPARNPIVSGKANTKPTPWQPSMCRITHTVGGSKSIGSGTWLQVGENRFVLTCAHLFQDGKGSVTVEFSSLHRYQAELLEIDVANDLAALRIPALSETPRRVGSATPGGVLTACGFGSTGQYACVSGPIAGYATVQGTNYPSLKIRGMVRSGDSGGGVFDTRGALVGVIWGTRDRLTYATYGMPLKSFLQRVADRLNMRSRPNQGILNTKPMAPVRPPSRTLPANAPSTHQFGQRLSALEKRVNAWPDPATLSQRSELKGLARATDLDRFATNQQLLELEGRSTSQHSLAIETIRSKTLEIAVETRQAAIEAAKQSVAGKVGLLGGLSTTKLLIGAVGIGSPAGLAIATGFVLLRFRRKWRAPGGRGGRSPPGAASGERLPLRESEEGTRRSVPIAVDSPPIVQNAIPETHYVPYERNGFTKAYQWASEQVARKYPGAVDTLTALDSLIKQQVNAQQQN